MDKIQKYIVYVISPILLMTLFFALMGNAGTISWLFIPIIGVSMLIIYMELFVMSHPSMKKEFAIEFAILVLGTTCIGVFGKNEIYHVFYLLEIFMLFRFAREKAFGGC